MHNVLRKFQALKELLSLIIHKKKHSDIIFVFVVTTNGVRHAMFL